MRRNGCCRVPRSYLATRTACRCYPRWLKPPEKLNLVKTLATFAVQYWYYQQLYILGETGSTSNDLSVFAATRQQMKLANELAAARN